jgi:hypothetical protein
MVWASQSRAHARVFGATADWARVCLLTIFPALTAGLAMPPLRAGFTYCSLLSALRAPFAAMLRTGLFSFFLVTISRLLFIVSLLPFFIAVVLSLLPPAMLSSPPYTDLGRGLLGLRLGRLAR